MSLLPRARFPWQLRTRTLELGERTRLLGIVNVTPDSFSDGGLFRSVEAAVTHALRLLTEGADGIDLGAESTRPGATPVSADEEQARLLPVLEALLRTAPATIVSVDTYHAATARAAVVSGAEIVNDVSGLMWDEDMAAALAGMGVGAILMHTRGRPTEWADLPALSAQQILPLVLAGLRETLVRAQAAGMQASRIVVDPGFGFGKRGEENMALHAGLDRLRELGYPVLVGSSRKRFLTSALAEVTPEARAHATTASNVAAILAGAHLLRVHDVAAARAAAQVADRILAMQP